MTELQQIGLGLLCACFLVGLAYYVYGSKTK